MSFRVLSSCGGIRADCQRLQMTDNAIIDWLKS